MENNASHFPDASINFSRPSWGNLMHRSFLTIPETILKVRTVPVPSFWPLSIGHGAILSAPRVVDRVCEVHKTRTVNTRRRVKGSVIFGLHYSLNTVLAYTSFFRPDIRHIDETFYRFNDIVSQNEKHEPQFSSPLISSFFDPALGAPSLRTVFFDLPF